MVIIYGIKCNITNMLYIGSTQDTLHNRLNFHKSKSNGCMSRKIINNNDYNIYEIERCDENIRDIREQYWIDNTDNINHNNVISDRKEYIKKYNEYYRNNILNKDDNKKYQKKYHKKYHKYKSSWGGDDRSNNKLLLIDINLFI